MGNAAGLLASLGVSAVGTAASTYGQVTAARSQADYEKRIANINAQAAELKADSAIQRGEAQAIQQGVKARQVMGAQRAALAAQGVDVNSGSALMAQQETAASGAFDERTIMNNAYMEAYGYKSQAIENRFQGKFAGMAAKQKAAGSILSGGVAFGRDALYAKQIYDKYGS